MSGHDWLREGLSSSFSFPRDFSTLAVPQDLPKRAAPPYWACQAEPRLSVVRPEISHVAFWPGAGLLRLVPELILLLKAQCSLTVSAVSSSLAGPVPSQAHLHWPWGGACGPMKGSFFSSIHSLWFLCTRGSIALQKTIVCLFSSLSILLLKEQEMFPPKGEVWSSLHVFALHGFCWPVEFHPSSFSFSGSWQC